MGSARRIFIVGGDGNIGRALSAAHTALGDRVVTTSRREVSKENASVLALDLGDIDVNWRPSERFEIAYLCAATTSIQACESSPETTRRVNVDGILRVARALIAQGTFVVFFSSNLVFDGEQPNVEATALTCPRCEYGQQKAAVEKALANEAPQETAIVRLTKVIDPTHTLITTWTSALRARQTITPFADLQMAPVAIDDVVAASLLISSVRASGVHHVSAQTDISYAALATYLAAELSVDIQLITPEPHGAANAKLYSPRHTTLGPSSWLSQSGWRRPRPQRAVDAFLKNMSFSLS
jgi:dTDP-4-dehydrorhamnose reductase